jgi:LPXTG-site transpeptidase (sortase) family protein
MPERAHIGLDNAAFSGRLRARQTTPTRPTVKVGLVVESYSRQHVPSPATRNRQLHRIPPTAQLSQSAIVPKPAPQTQHLPVFQPAQPPALQPITAVTQQVPVKQPKHTRKLKLNELRQHATRLIAGYSKPQLAIGAMAAFVFVLGVGVSLQTLFTNQAATAQVSALSRGSETQAATSDVATGQAGHASAPSTVKPTAKAYGSYAVTGDLARYIKIPKLGVSGRVLQVGINNDGALGTPNNVYDAAWYTGSAKPGQPGATLIDGHVSSWTSHGIFYGLKKLVAGDTIQLQRGDGQILTYRVVRSQVYNADNVDMQAAVLPVTKGKSGLNLITCTGRVKPGTSEFNERVIVFAEQI